MSNENRLHTIRLVFVLCFLLVGSARAEDDGHSALLIAARSQWQKYRQFLGSAQGTVTYRFLTDGTPYLESRHDFKQNANCTLMVVERRQQMLPNQQATIGLICANAQYAFSLARSTKEKPWYVTGCVPADDPSSALIHETRDVRGAPTLLLKLVAGWSLEDLVSHPKFQITGDRKVTLDGVSLVELNFDVTHPWDQDPAQSWCLRSATLQCVYRTGPLCTDLQAEYRATPEGFPIPVSVVHETQETESVGTSSKRRTMSVTADLEVPRVLPGDDEFRLSAFGFPEPDFAARGSKFYLWLAALGIVCLTSAILLRRLLRRRPTAQ
jgi:hypothetical protein